LIAVAAGGGGGILVCAVSVGCCYCMYKRGKVKRR
jgi:hypothetical protein